MNGMFYFIKWLGKRVTKTLFKEGHWQWIESYRDLIMREKPLAILLTFLMGALWFVGMGAVVALTSDTRPPQYVFMTLLSVPPLFFIYNWLAALYEIYSEERERTMNYLKEDPNHGRI